MEILNGIGVKQDGGCGLNKAAAAGWGLRGLGILGVFLRFRRQFRELARS